MSVCLDLVFCGKCGTVSHSVRGSPFIVHSSLHCIQVTSSKNNTGMNIHIYFLMLVQELLWDMHLRYDFMKITARAHIELNLKRSCYPFEWPGHIEFTEHLWIHTSAPWDLSLSTSPAAPALSNFLTVPVILMIRTNYYVFVLVAFFFSLFLSNACLHLLTILFWFAVFFVCVRESPLF